MATAVAPSNGPNISLSDVDDLWRKALALLQDGRTNEIQIPFSAKAIIGQQGLDVIKTRFQYLIAKQVDVYENSLFGFIGMRVASYRGPECILTHNAPELKVKKMAADKNAADKNAKVPRPPNAFILYRQHHHPLVKAEFPDMHNNQISIILGTQWKNETVLNKYHWNTLAKEIKEKHLQANPDYSYQPRKPSEKKRRMTRRKAAVMAGMTDTLTVPSSSVQVSSSMAATAVQSALTSSAPVSLTGTYDQQTTLPIDELPFGTLDFERTEAGNAIVNIGDNDISNAALSAMLDNYNKHQPAMANPFRQPFADNDPPLIYTEDDEHSASGINFFDNTIGWNELTKKGKATTAKANALPNNTTAAAADAAWNALTLTQQTTLFDLNNEEAYASELTWMEELFGLKVVEEEGTAQAQDSLGQDSVVASNVDDTEMEDPFELNTFSDGDFVLE